MKIIKDREEILNLTDNEIRQIFRYNRSINKDYIYFLGFSKMLKEETQDLLLNIYDRNITIYIKQIQPIIYIKDFNEYRNFFYNIRKKKNRD